jgi:hypothetical protein
LGASSSPDVRNIQSPFRSRIDIEDYQLDPLIRAEQMPRVNLLMADKTGDTNSLLDCMVTDTYDVPLWTSKLPQCR